MSTYIQSVLRRRCHPFITFTTKRCVTIESRTHVSQNTVNSFEKSLSKNARLLQPWDKDYKANNRLWNSAFDCVSPAFILMAQNTDDVVKSVYFCRDNGLEITPRAGRHNLAGFSSIENGFVIDFREMTSISVNTDNETITFEPGCKSQIVEDYLWYNYPQYGISGVMEPSIGLCGAYLGIGHGHLQRYLGNGTDNIIELKAVLSNGDVVKCNQHENTDAFFGFKGTHSNMGIVTDLTIKLHNIFDEKQGKENYHGFMYFDIKHGTQIFEEITKLSEKADFPDSIGIVYEIIQEEGKWCARLTYSHYIFYKDIQDENKRNLEAEKWSKPIKDLMNEYNGTYIVPFEWVTHYDQQTKFVFLPQSLSWYTSAGFVTKNDSDCVYNELVKHFTNAPSECSQCSVFMLLYGGELDKRDATSSANPVGKGMKWLVMYWSLWDDKTNDGDINYMNGKIAREFTRNSFYSIKPFLRYGYVNGVAYDQNSDQHARFVYGENYDRLKAIKQKYDPINLFKNNLNIVPSKYYRFDQIQDEITYIPPMHAIK